MFSTVKHSLQSVLEKVVAYFISSAIPADTRLVRIGLGLAVILIILGIIFPFVIGWRWRHSVWHKRQIRIPTTLLLRLAGVVWFLAFFLRYETIVPFNRRIWAYLPILPVAGMLFFLRHRYHRLAPEHIKEKLLAKQYGSYLPQSKTKRVLPSTKKIGAR